MAGIGLYFAEGIAFFFAPELIKWFPFTASGAVVEGGSTGTNVGGITIGATLDTGTAILVTIGWLVAQPGDRGPAHRAGRDLRAEGPPHQPRRATGASEPLVSATRSAAASSISRPRRPAETWMVGHEAADASTTVGRARRVPSGEIPPST